MLEVRNMHNSQLSPMVASCLEDATQRLAAKFAGVFSQETIGRTRRAVDRLGLAELNKAGTG
jgi:hypothetical protein